MTVVEPSITEAAAAAASNVTNALPNLPPARAIPTTFGASVKSWWASGEKEGAASEERLLRFVPHDLRPYFPRLLYVRSTGGYHTLDPQEHRR
jgi:hypothetical protein